MTKNQRELGTNELKPGQWLRLLREYKDLSREALARETRRSEEAIIKWEQGESTPRAESIKPVLKYLGVPNELIENHVRWFRNLPPLHLDWQPWMPWNPFRTSPQSLVDQTIAGNSAAVITDPTTPLSLPPTSSTPIPAETPKSKPSFPHLRTMLMLLCVLTVLSLLMVYFNFPKSKTESLVVPYVQTLDDFKLDGNCNKYTTALVKQFSNHNGNASTTRLVHDGVNLYICITSDAGSFKDRNSAVFLNNLDVTSLRYELVVFTARPERWSLEDNGGGWIKNPSLDSLWRSTTNTIPEQSESFEYAIPLKDFRLGLCSNEFRVAVYHQWVDRFGTAYGWPIIKDAWVKPDVWLPAKLANAPCSNRP